MNDRSPSCGTAPDAQPQARIWTFTMDGYLPDGDAPASDANPTPADLAADRLLERLDGLRRQWATRLTFSALRSRRARHERTG